MEASGSSSLEICPTCGTKLPEDASRCLVCGTDVSGGGAVKSSTAVQGSRMPVITLSLPVALVTLALFLGIGAVLVFLYVQGTPEAIVSPTPSPTSTSTLTPTASATPETPVPTNTPVPTPTPFTYIVKDGDLCSSIAFNFDVSITSIVRLNNLPADCGTLFIDQEILIPAPTATPSPLPSATLSGAEATEQACEKVAYEVEDNDTLSGIALNYNVPIDAIKDYNGLTTDSVFSGQLLQIPLCRRNPTPGPTPTPTPPPPYSAPALLLPADGSPFNLADDAVTLQWASVGTLRDNEAYAVTVEDVTEGEGRRVVEYVIDTKYIVPVTLRPDTATPHVFRWWVVAVRQVGTDEQGRPIYDTAGTVSDPRVFTWSGSSTPGGTPTP
ncbi:MAG: LysM peptidoglycan-binding domain-containing protein [Anaerolineales bacterium]|nr:LysM peptidoglycan-binding domain-containing protein [Anaerolineales bacterium]